MNCDHVHSRDLSWSNDYHPQSWSMDNAIIAASWRIVGFSYRLYRAIQPFWTDLGWCRQRRWPERCRPLLWSPVLLQLSNIKAVLEDLDQFFLDKIKNNGGDRMIGSCERSCCLFGQPYRWLVFVVAERDSSKMLLLICPLCYNISFYQFEVESLPELRGPRPLACRIGYHPQNYRMYWSQLVSRMFSAPLRVSSFAYRHRWLPPLKPVVQTKVPL